MKLKVLGSGSQGNCYILESRFETLIIEAGLTIREIMKGIDYNTSKVVGCLCSHLHMDHFKSISELSKRFINVYSNKEVIDKLGSGTILEEKKLHELGSFKVMPLTVKHDVECYSFVIIHQEFGKLLFVTDAASFHYNIKGINHLLIEVNYCESIQEEYMLRNFDSHNNIDRLRQSHLSLEQAKDIIIRHDSIDVKTVMLLHLSSRNSDGDYFKEDVQKVCGKPVLIAKRGLEVTM